MISEIPGVDQGILEEFKKAYRSCAELHQAGSLIVGRNAAKFCINLGMAFEELMWVRAGRIIYENNTPANPSSNTAAQGDAPHGDA